MSTSTQVTAKRLRGFANLTLEQRQAIASKGGKTAHAKGVGNKFTSETGQAAGLKGGRGNKVKGRDIETEMDSTSNVASGLD